MLLFFATIGASCGCLPSPAQCAPLAAYIALMCTVHGAVLAFVGRALRLSPAALLVGCNACIGGPATAAGALRVLHMQVHVGEVPGPVQWKPPHAVF